MAYFGEPSPRMWEFRNLVHAQPYRICMERAQILTEAYQKYEAYEIHTKRALAMRDVLGKISLMLDPHDLLPGYPSAVLRACPIFPEYSIDWLVEELDTFEKRPGDAFYLTDTQKQQLRAMQPYWHGRTLEARALTMLPEEAVHFHDAGIVRAQNTMMCGDGHIAVNYRRLLREGLGAYRTHAVHALEKLDLTEYAQQKRYDFLRAVPIMIDACIEFAHRNAAFCREQAAASDAPARRQELLQLAQICERVPEHPAETFHEAVESVWMVQLLLQLESNGHSVSLGRLDQYLYPYYKADLDAGRITQEYACMLLENLWIKLYSVNKIRPWKQTQFTAGSPMYENVTIGGADSEGHTQVNALSYLMIRTVANMHLTQPNLTVRYHSSMPEEFMHACIELIKQGFGMPAFNNDEIIVPSLERLGVTKEDAADYSAIGCVEVAVPGRWGYRCTGMSYLNFSKMLNVALNGGCDDISGKRIYQAQRAWEAYDTFDKLMEGWKEVCRLSTRQAVIYDTVVDNALEELCPDILCSALVDDCIDRGLSLKQGGAVYDFVSGLQVGIANTGNALAAIRKTVFEDHVLTMQQLHAAMEANFEGAENARVRQLLLNAPKYGCDDDAADELTAEAFRTYIREIANYHNTRYGRGPIGGTYYAGTSSVSANTPCGACVAATPDGRLAFTPLAEGCSPSSGTDTNGPTGVFCSIAKLPLAEITGGVLLNQKLMPSCLKTEADSAKLSMLIRTFMDTLKGFHVQYNYVDRKTLEDAQLHPEQHKDLIVRVAGYSAFFTVLSPQTQNDIIGRTEHVL